MKIIMSERTPVNIEENEWPLVATAADGSGETLQLISVRQHADGRRLVYGKHGTTYAGFLVEPGPKASSETVRAIHRVAGIIACRDLGDECVAQLPGDPL